MENFLNLILQYLNPITWLNALWELCIDLLYMFLQFGINLLTGLAATINWVCPVFPSLSPPPMFTQVVKSMAWVIPWHYGAQMILVMIGCTMFAVMVCWTLRWLKVVR